MDYSPSILPRSKRLNKRRSSSMFNLHEQKNLIEKDMVLSKLNVIRKKNIDRRNYRNNLIGKNRNIDIDKVCEETPMPVRTIEPILKSENFEMETEDLEIKYNLDDESVVNSQPSQVPASKMTNIKNKINTLKNNFRNIISGGKTKTSPVKTEPKKEPQVCIIFNKNNALRVCYKFLQKILFKKILNKSFFQSFVHLRSIFFCLSL